MKNIIFFLLVFGLIFNLNCFTSKNNKMSTVGRDFKILNNLQRNFLSQNDIIYNQGASDEEIKAAELAFGASFPQEMKDLYKFANGNRIYPDYFGSPRLIRGKFSLFSLKDAIKYYNDIDWDEYEDLYEPDCFPGDKLFPIMDGGKFDVYWIDLNQDSINKYKIYYTNTLGSPHCYVFLSIENMIQTFKIAYERNMIHKNDEIIKIDYDEFYKLCYDQTGYEIWK